MGYVNYGRKLGYEYYWRTHAHPGSTFRYTTSSLLDLMRWDATDQIELIDQPLLMIAGGAADSLYMSQDAFAQATGTADKELWIPPGAKHWHGAAPNAGMTNVAIAEAHDGKSVDWMEQVSDAQYTR